MMSVDTATLAIGLPALQEARAVAALPAAGAWDASPTELFVSEATWLTIVLTYTRGAAGGAVDWQLEHSIYSVLALAPVPGNEWSEPTAYAVGAVVGGVDTQSLEQQEYITYESIAAGSETFTYGPVCLGGTVERIRIRARESGVVGTPGTCQIQIVAQ